LTCDRLAASWGLGTFLRAALEGPAIASGSQAELIQAHTGRHVWAERYDRELSDIFVLQDEITSSIVGAIEPSLRYAEIGRSLSKPTESLSAYDLYLQALPHSYLASNEGYRRAEDLLRQALERDPNYADALAALADCIARMYLNGWQSDLNQTRLEVAHFAERAVDSGPTMPTQSRFQLGRMQVILGQIAEAAALADRALALNPNSAHVRMCSAFAIMYDGRFDEAIRLSPLDPRTFTPCSGIGMCHFFLRRFDECGDGCCGVFTTGRTNLLY
jgi:adenylate cyclase